MSDILIAEDDHDIADLIARFLTRAGHRADVVHSGAEALRRIRATPPDLIVLDLMLPELSGLDVCRAVRAAPDTAALPIIMLTARADEPDRILGLESGADDYIVKPFSPKELVARVGAVLRRARPAAPEEQRLTYGSLQVDVDRHVVSEAGREVHLTAKEFLLLKYLIEHQGRVLSRDLLLSDVWGYQYTGGTRTVDVHIRRLREKLPLTGEAITTVKQFGYKLLTRGSDADR